MGTIQEKGCGQFEKVKRELEEVSKYSPDKIKAIQGEKLRSIVEHHYLSCPAYKRLMDSDGVNPSDIKTVDDLTKLPFVEKKHLLEDQPFGFVSVPPHEIARFIETSGSTGKSKQIAVSKSEKGRIFELVARALCLGGFENDDGPILSLFPYGPWPSGFFVQHGAEIVGRTLAAEISLPKEWHVDRIKLFNPKYMISSPSFAPKLYEECKDDIDFKELGLKRVLVGGERMSPAFRKRLEKAFHTKVLDIYGCAEFGVPCVECEHQKGLHYFADEYIIEIVDPNTLKPVEPGNKGEMVVTALFKKSMPIIRYRVRDLAYFQKDPYSCPCGRNLPLMSNILGRTDDVISLGGYEVYPDMLWGVIDEFPELSDKFQFIVEEGKSGGEFGKDKATLKIELIKGAKARPNLDEEILGLLKEKYAPIGKMIKSGYILSPQIEIEDNGELYKGTGKFKRFVDLRV